ncbi:hypothetical protein FRC07_010516 [Ceratobasidium sp. 392]|nr:hypothetical protein FRC07_010516 [Ceratobasidium sp. 392]
MPAHDEFWVKAEGIVAFMEPHLHRICVLSLQPDDVFNYFVPALLHLWSGRSNINYPRSLFVGQPAFGEVVFIDQNDESESEDLEKMLLALNTLHLSHVLIDWSSNAHCGLVDLQLDLPYLSISVSTRQLARIFSASPALGTPKLGPIKVHHTKNWVQPAPVLMGCLEVLNLIEMMPDDAHSLLSLITSTSPRAELSIRLAVNTVIDDRIVGFFSRSKISTLYCLYNTGSLKDWKRFFRYLPSLDALILHGYDLVGVSVDEPNRLLTPPSRVTSVTFLGCTIKFDSLKRFLLVFDLQELRLEGCSVSTKLGHYVRDVPELLREIYPNLQCSDESGADWSEHLACRMMFDDYRA